MDEFIKYPVRGTCRRLHQKRDRIFEARKTRAHPIRASLRLVRPMPCFILRIPRWDKENTAVRRRIRMRAGGGNGL